ncbi:hypothetical protein ACFXPA_00155 [Amycolatopsis sp. NPDC059090]|uniref:hypothetical protein n=1 Tax=unclassified Amycolatopsis TaxID=2618356 RepID=UPI003671642E
MSELRRAASRVKRLVFRAGHPALVRFHHRVERIVDGRLRPEIDATRSRIDEVRDELRAEFREELRRVNARCDELDGHVKWLYDEQRRLAPHIAALDARVAAFERPGSPGRLAERLEYAADEADEVRAEHARIRARLSAVSKYEERLARVEEKLGREN